MRYPIGAYVNARADGPEIRGYVTGMTHYVAGPGDESIPTYDIKGDDGMSYWFPEENLFPALPSLLGSDPVNHPSHYTWGPVEVIEITEGLNFCLGNVIKYVLRADHKGNPIEDLKKAAWYLERELQRRQKESA